VAWCRRDLVHQLARLGPRDRPPTGCGPAGRRVRRAGSRPGGSSARRSRWPAWLKGMAASNSPRHRGSRPLLRLLAALEVGVPHPAGVVLSMRPLSSMKRSRSLRSRSTGSERFFQTPPGAARPPSPRTSALARLSRRCSASSSSPRKGKQEAQQSGPRSLRTS
jgi:hypothetical protein